MRNAHLLLFVGAAALGACSSSSATNPMVRARVEKKASAIIGGTEAPDETAVVLFRGDGDCSAVFIAENVLLTAAHCVAGEDGVRRTTKFALSFAATEAAGSDRAVPAEDVYVHPAYRGTDHDIAGVILRSAPTASAANIRPLSMSDVPLSAADVGKSVRLIGYGATMAAPPPGGGSNDDGFGIRRHVTTTIDKLDRGFVKVGRAGQTACSGDSGGPALMMVNGVERVIGIDSYSEAEIDCSEGEHYQRLDTESEFITSLLTRGAAALPSTPSAPPAGESSQSSPDESNGSDSADGETTTSGSNPQDPDAATASGCAITVTANSARHKGASSTLAIGAVLAFILSLRKKFDARIGVKRHDGACTHGNEPGRDCSSDQRGRCADQA